MADNTILNTGSGGDEIRTEQHGGAGPKTPVSLIDVGGTGASESIVGDAGVFMPVEGAAAENAAVAGDPILVGGRYDSTPRTLDAGDAGAIAIAPDGAVYVTEHGEQSSGNTSTTPLGSSATFTGTGEQNLHPDVMVSCLADQTGTLYFDFSVDGTNWNTFPTAGFTVAANVHEFHTAVKGPRYFRIRLVNDATPQTTLRLYTYFGSFARGNTPVGVAINDDSDAAVTHSVLTGKTGGGSYVNVGSTTGGSLKMNLEEIAENTVAVGAGNVTTGTQRVVIASDQPTVTVDTDGGNPLSVTLTGTNNIDAISGPVTVSSITNAVVVSAANDSSLTARIGDGTITATVRDMGVSNNDALNVAICDATGGQITSFGGGTEYTEDVASPTDPVGGALIARYRSTLGSEADTSGDWVALSSTIKGELHVKHTDTIAVTDNGGSLTVDGTVTVNGTVNIGSSVTVTNAGTFAVQVSSALPTGTNTIGNVNAQGAVAHDAVDSGNPIKLGAKADGILSANTMVADNDRTNLHADVDGTLITRVNHPFGDMLQERVSDTTGTSTAFTNFAAQGASIRNYITAISITNTSATDGYVDFRDGTAGAILWTVPIPANGGVVIPNGGHPLFRTTANTALAYDVSAAISTVFISVSGFKSKA